jgi:ligand-binding sensor domain-containing protein/signal transduction histidine kinase/CheY-like chemotaxis protein
MHKRTFLTFLILLIFSSVFGQLSFDHLSITSGLSQSTVLSIYKDSRGYMWFGTRDCLNRYDGRKVKVYKTDENDPSSISANDYIYTIHEDKDKNLWIGTQNGLNRYIPETDSFERIPYAPNHKSSISNLIVLTVTSGNNGRLWFGTNYGLSLLKNSSSRDFQKFYSKDGLAGDAIYAVLEDSKGNVWVGTTQGLTVMRPKNGKYSFTSYKHVATDAGSISANSVKTITEDKKGNIWIGTETDGVNLFVPQTQSFLRFKFNPLQENSLSNNNIRKIIVDKTGDLWIATMNGLNIMDAETRKIKVYKHDSDNNKSLSDNSIKDIFQDNHGSVWIGTMFGGVNVTHLNTIPFAVEKHSKYRNSISSDIISVIAADEQGNLWIGTEGQGLNQYHIKNKTYRHFINNPLDASSLSSNTIKSVFKDRKGQMWIGLFQGGLELFVPSTGKFKHYRPDPKNPHAISYGYVSSITEDKKGYLWVGTSFKGLNQFDPEKQLFKVYNDQPSSILKLSSSYIRVVYSDSKNNLWVGTANGLNLIGPDRKQVKYFFGKKGSAGHLQSNHINSIKEDSKGNIWIGSYHGGLSLYQPKTGSFSTYNTKHGIASDNIIDILEDNEGYLWVSTDRGLSKFDVGKKVFKNYTTRDGLPANEFNYQSAYKDKNGKLYFGSYNGLVSFTPQEIEENKNVPKVVFSDLKLFNIPVPINGPDKLLTKDISLTEAITFKASQNIFTIEFLALNYIKPERNRFAYKLEGFEKDWNYVNTPSATYTNLPAGTYDLLVKASNNDGLWNDDPARLTIRILPPLWKTWWAYLLYLIVMVSTLYFVIRFFRRQARLETELYYEHLNNENLQKLYQTKLDFFTRISHEIRTPLTLIAAPLENLIQYTAGNGIVSKQLTQIKSNTDRLLRLISELLDFRKIESGNMRVMVSEHNLVSFCKEIFESFKVFASQKHINYTFNSEKEVIPAYFDSTQLEKVFYNILSNAFKYTAEGGAISFHINDEGERIHISITDNGIGIPVEDQEKIFTNFYQVNYTSAKKEGWGIGLALTKNIVEQHHGDISISSIPHGKDTAGSTSFKVTLNKGKSFFNEDQVVEEHKVGEAVQVNVLPERVEENIVEDESISKEYVILIVEDNDELRAFIRESLERRYHILESDNGLSGWEMAKEQIPDVIISDVTMPGMDGLELCEKLKNEEITSHIPVIMLTALAASMHQVDGLEAGADIYLTKPFSIQVLELSVKNVIASREALKEKFSKQVMLMPRRVEIQSPDEKFLNKLMQLVEDHMEDPDFNVSVLVTQIGMSQTVLYKKIKALTDLSITDFIKSQRLKRAAQLLTENKMNISEVAYSVGFNDRKYFSKEFKKQFGKAPTDYITGA